MPEKVDIERIDDRPEQPNRNRRSGQPIRSLAAMGRNFSARRTFSSQLHRVEDQNNRPPIPQHFPI
jgi:hypothetical protein